MNSNPNPQGNTDHVFHKNRVFTTNDAWLAIKESVGVYELPKGWERIYAGRSLTIVNPKRSFIFKVTVNQELYVDRKINGVFHSEHHLCKSNKELTDLAVQILDMAVPKVQNLQ